MGFWNKLIAHPAYDAFWQDQAMDKILAEGLSEEGIKVPMLLVRWLWDQEDIYGALAVYKAIKPKDTDNDKVFLVLGPWHHGQEIGDGRSLGAMRFGSDTGTWFRQNVLAPFLAHYLKDDAPAMDIAPVTAYETGTRRMAEAAGLARCTRRPERLYLRSSGSSSTLHAADSASRDRELRPRSTSTSPIPPNRFPTAPVPQPARRLRPRRSPGRTGSSTTSARPPAAPTC